MRNLTSGRMASSLPEPGFAEYILCSEYVVWVLKIDHARPEMSAMAKPDDVAAARKAATAGVTEEGMLSGELKKKVSLPSRSRASMSAVMSNSTRHEEGSMEGRDGRLRWMTEMEELDGRSRWRGRMEG